MHFDSLDPIDINPHSDDANWHDELRAVLLAGAEVEAAERRGA